MDFQQFSETLDNARKGVSKHKYQCCIPGCKKTALEHSHIVPQCVLKKYICDDKNKLIQCQIDEIHPMSTGITGELPFEKFTTLGLAQAMSMPIFCKQHDNDLFSEYEKNADAIEPFNINFQILQSLRAIGALRHTFERNIIQHEFMKEYNDFFAGGVFEDEKKNNEYLIRRCDSTISYLYDLLEKEDYDPFEFTCIQLEQIKLAICDVLIDEDDLIEHCMDEGCNKPFNALYIHLLPKENNSFLILGYNKKLVSKEQMVLMGKWISELKYRKEVPTIYEILCNCSNNWCVSPDCGTQILDYLKNNYSIDRINNHLK